MRFGAKKLWHPGPGHSPGDRSLIVTRDPKAPGGFVVHSFSPRDDWRSCRAHVWEKLGLPPRNHNGGFHPETILATYDYTDATGKLLFQVVRMTPKKFRIRRPDGVDGWLWNLGDARRVLYHLPAVCKAIETGKHIYVCEGEKACDAVASSDTDVTEMQEYLQQRAGLRRVTKDTVHAAVDLRASERPSARGPL